MRYHPHPYQEEATRLILDKPNVALWMAMGLGKTVSTLTALAELIYDRFEVYRCLVVAPLRVAQSTWSTEIQKWEHLSCLRLSKVLGSKDKRIQALSENADIYVINRENIPWLVTHFGKKWPFDMVVIDEASSFKSSKAQRFRALRKMKPFIKRMVQLTGTPSPNGLMDLWPQAYLLDGGERLEKTLGAYQRKYFVPGRRNGHIVYEWLPLPTAMQDVQAALRDVCYSMSTEDWLKMPDRIDNTITVDLGAAKKVYDRIERDLVIQLAGADVVASNAAVLAGKLLQMANGAVYDDTGTVQQLHNAKLEALDSVIKESANLLVFYTYKHDLLRILERHPEARCLNGPEDIDDWNAGRIKVLLAHPASSGHGLNLQQGGHEICWFGLPWSLELYQQANARLHRQGQSESVIVHHLVAKDTLDEHVVKVLGKKGEGQDELLGSLKARIGEIT